MFERLRAKSTTVKLLQSSGGLKLLLKVHVSADLQNWQDAWEVMFEKTVDSVVPKKFFRFGAKQGVKLKWGELSRKSNDGSVVAL